MTEFPGNTPSSFENRINNLNLDPTLEYEACILRILHPRKYAALSNDVRLAYSLKITTMDSHTGDDLTYFSVFSPTEKVEAGNMTTLCTSFRKMVFKAMETVLEVNSLRDISITPPSHLIKYDIQRGVVVMKRFLVKEDKRGNTITSIQLKFNSKLGKVFGIPEDEWMEVSYRRGQESENMVIGRFTPQIWKDVQVLYIYSDLVRPVRFAEKQVGIFNIAERNITGDVKTYASPVVYVPLNKKQIQTIAILVTDDTGEPAPFDAAERTTVLLHIRPTQKL